MRVPVWIGGEIGAWALVDDDFAEAQRRWHLGPDGYVGSWLTVGRLHMHRVVLGLQKGDALEGDHINGDKLDNRRSNLRALTRAQNAQNRPAQHGVRGVSRAGRKWRVQIGLDGRNHHVGMFSTEEEAAVAAADWYAEHVPFANPERHRAAT